jgi:hypothetical protein
MNYLTLVFRINSHIPPGIVGRSYGRGIPFHWLLSGIALLLALLAPGNLLQAQTFYGSISGVVKDPSGAVLPGVAVTVHENTTTTEYKSVSNKSGAYRISFLKPGSYTVRFEKDGFAQYVTDELNIVLNQELVVDGSLKLGTTSEIITVTGAASSINSTNSQIGGELSTRSSSIFPKPPAPKAQTNSSSPRPSPALPAPARTTPTSTTSPSVAAEPAPIPSSSMVCPATWA